MASSETTERVMTRLSAVSDELDLPAEPEELAVTLFNRMVEDPEFTLKRADPLGASVLVTACRREGISVTVSEVTATWTEVANDSRGEFDESTVFDGLQEVKQVTGIGELPPTPEELIGRFANELGVPAALEHVAQRLLEDASDATPALGEAGKSPSGLAAAALYLSIRIHDRRMDFPQHEIAAVTNVSKVTIRNRYQEMAELLGGEDELRTTDRYKT